MRKLNILKTVLDIFWVFSIIGVIGTIIFIAFYLFDSDMNIPLKINGQVIDSQSLFSKITVMVSIFSALMFLYSVYLLRKVITMFQKMEIFNDEVVRLLNLIGKLIILSSIISSVSLYIYNRIEDKNVDLTLDFGASNTLIISIILGLFFMVISEIFKIAKNMKEESELTI